MKTHELKCWPEPFESIRRGAKRHEIRHDDRGFEVDDFLWLREWNPVQQVYTGREFTVRVTYIVHGGHGAGLERVPEDIAVMSITTPSDDFTVDEAHSLGYSLGRHDGIREGYEAATKASVSKAGADA